MQFTVQGSEPERQIWPTVLVFANWQQIGLLLGQPKVKNKKKSIQRREFNIENRYRHFQAMAGGHRLDLEDMKNMVTLQQGREA